MRAIIPLFLSAIPVSAQIYADVSTTLGDFSIELYHEDSPKAVANLITLAEGTRSWVDSTTGAVRHNTPYYDGIIFHRVIDGFMNQAGSPNGTGSDGPGYNFPDEVENGLLHDEAYLLSAANSGPNTNGSQFFTTVVPTAWLDGIHTVYGKIVTGTATIDLINNTEVSGSMPTTPVVINSMTIRRVGVGALAFDEFAQGLPTVKEIDIEVISPTESDPAKLLLDQPAGTTLRIASSLDLESWSSADRYIDEQSMPQEAFLTELTREKEFFLPSLVEWQSEAAFPGSLLGETITIPSNIGVFTLTLTEPGMIVLSQTGQEDITGEIDYEQSVFDHDGYGATILIYSKPPGLVPIRFRFGADLPMVAPLTGRVTGTAFNAANTSISGTFTVGP